MHTDTQIAVLERLVKEVITEDPDLFLVEIKIKPTNNVRVYIDGDSGVGIGKLSQVNRALYKRIEDEAVFPDGDFSLEVSSPGLDEPLKLFRQYKKNIGRYVEVLRQDGVLTEGKLITVEEDGIIVEEEKGKKPHPRQTGKKAETVHHSILFDNIKTTKIQIKF